MPPQTSTLQVQTLQSACYLPVAARWRWWWAVKTAVTLYQNSAAPSHSPTTLHQCHQLSTPTHKNDFFVNQQGDRTQNSQKETDKDKQIYHHLGGRNSSVGCAWARCPQRRGFDPPLGKFSGTGDFSLGVNMGFKLHSPKNSFGWEYKPRSSLCTHAFHRMDSKDPDIHVLDGWMPATKTHPARTIHEDGMWLP